MKRIKMAAVSKTRLHFAGSKTAAAILTFWTPLPPPEVLLPVEITFVSSTVDTD